MSFARIIGNLALRSLGYAAGGAAAGATGPAVLAATGHVGYSVLEGTRAGAAGSAVVGPVISLIAELVEHFAYGEDKKSKSKLRDAIGELIISIGTSTLGGVLGHAMLANIAEMSLEQTAAAMAVGSSTIIAGAAATVLVLGGCVVIGGCIVGGSTQTVEVTTRATPRHFPAFGGFFGPNTETKAADIEAPKNDWSSETSEQTTPRPGN